MRSIARAHRSPQHRSRRLRDKPFIVVSGPPGSGKTTLGAKLAVILGLPLLDKDDILEALFDAFEDVDLEARQRLSRASDGVLQRIADTSRGAVIVSFWRQAGVNPLSGTPTAWLKSLSDNLVEVHCDCPAAIAADRFRTRERHPGHKDEDRSYPFDDLAALGAVRLGPLVTVQTWKPYDIAAVAEQVRGHLDGSVSTFGKARRPPSR